jgi:hypothetical protein
MSNIIKSFSFKEDKLQIIQKFDAIAEKEKKKFSELLVEQIEDYVKKHGDGNPAFTLDQFQDKNFRACPAFYRQNQDWYSYLMSLSKQEFKEAWQQRNTVLNAFDKADKDRLK